MTASLIEKLRRSRGEHGWLENLKEGSTEHFVESIRRELKDPSWDFGPAELFAPYLEGKDKYVLAAKDNGMLLRVRVEGNALNFKFGEVEVTKTPEEIPTLAEEVLASGHQLIDHLLDEDTDEDFDPALAIQAMFEAVVEHPELPDDIVIAANLKDLSEEKLWYRDQVPSTVKSRLHEHSSLDETYTRIKALSSSVAEMVTEHEEDIGTALGVVVEAVLDGSHKLLQVLKSCFDLEESGESGVSDVQKRRYTAALKSALPIEKGLVFIQDELISLGESESENLEADKR